MCAPPPPPCAPSSRRAAMRRSSCWSRWERTARSTSRPAGPRPASALSDSPRPTGSRCDGGRPHSTRGAQCSRGGGGHFSLQVDTTGAGDCYRGSFAAARYGEMTVDLSILGENLLAAARAFLTGTARASRCARRCSGHPPPARSRSRCTARCRACRPRRRSRSESSSRSDMRGVRTEWLRSGAQRCGVCE